MEERVRLLESRLTDLQFRYDSRESRPEDVERIKQLTAELKEAKQLVKRTLEEMQYFKLELLNREENFNKVFNANPNVGILDPRQAAAAQKKDRGASAAAFGSSSGAVQLNVASAGQGPFGGPAAASRSSASLAVGQAKPAVGKVGISAVHAPVGHNKRESIRDLATKKGGASGGPTRGSTSGEASPPDQE